MIKTLIVDDEKLVRKGLIAMMPWEACGFRIEGDAASAEKALELLKENEYNLLITDLTMPGLSGFDLMNRVRELYPQLPVVVLTCHQDFHYIQEAMRAGAIDYIVKTQLEQDETGDLLSRIAARIKHDSQFQRFETPPEERSSRMKAGYMLCATGEEARTDDIYRIGWMKSASLYEVDKGAWFIPRTEDNRDQELEAYRQAKLEEWILVDIADIPSGEIADICKRLRAYLSSTLFYEFRAEKRRYELSLAEIPVEAPTLAEEEIVSYMEQWKMPGWAYNDSLFAEQIEQIERRKPPIGVIKRLYYSSMEEWAELFDTRRYVNLWSERMERFTYWQHWTDWLREVSRTLQTEARRMQYSEEVVNSILKAVQWMNEHVGSDINQGELAKRVGLSRSYFSQCFKGIMGRTFGEYMKEMRLEKAKALLSHTSKPIYAIAEQTGFQDDKYFSKWFKEHTDLLPTEYRHQVAQGESGSQTVGKRFT